MEDLKYLKNFLLKDFVMKNRSSSFSKGELKKLNYPCIFCGRDLFSASCAGVRVEDAIANKHCLVLGHIFYPNAPHSCHHFCFFTCNKRGILIDGFPIIDSNTGVTDDECKNLNEEYDNKFKSFSSLLKNRGFRI